MEHTPGPWTRHGLGISKDAGEYGYAVALCDSPVPPGEAEANARLIAAAPDLLTALEALMPMLEAHQAQDKSLTTYGHEIINAGRAAVAKAQP